jgi:hypothetical protein
VPANLEVLQRAVADTERALFEALARKTDPDGPGAPPGASSRDEP